METLSPLVAQGSPSPAGASASRVHVRGRASRVHARRHATALRYDIIGKERSTPARMPAGQREVTVLSLV